MISCESPSSPLVGKWQPVDEEGYIEFFNNGKFEIRGGYETISGTYEETSDNQVTLTADGQNPEFADENEQFTLEYSFSEDELILSDGRTPVSFIRAD
jgi:hypothetical protein